MNKVIIQLDNYMGSRDLKIKAGFMDLGHLCSHIALHSEGSHLGFYVRLSFILKFYWSMCGSRRGSIQCMCPEFLSVTCIERIPFLMSCEYRIPVTHNAWEFCKGQREWEVSVLLLQLSRQWEGNDSSQGSILYV